MPDHAHVLTLIPGDYSICRLTATEALPAWAATVGDDFVSVTRTRDELSIVSPSARVPSTLERRSDGWRCLKVEGPLDFALTGVLASIASPLASAKVSVFAVATFDTDYFLLRGVDLDRAVEALTRAGHVVRGA